MRQHITIAWKLIGNVALPEVAQGSDPIVSSASWEADRQQICNGIEIVQADLTAADPVRSRSGPNPIIWQECVDGHVWLSTMQPVGSAITGNCRNRSRRAVFCAHWSDPFKYVPTCPPRDRGMRMPLSFYANVLLTDCACRPIRLSGCRQHNWVCRASPGSNQTSYVRFQTSSRSGQFASTNCRTP